MLVVGPSGGYCWSGPKLLNGEDTVGDLLLRLNFLEGRNSEYKIRKTTNLEKQLHEE